MRKLLIVPAFVLMLTAFEESGSKSMEVIQKPIIQQHRTDNIDSLKNDVDNLKKHLSELNKGL